MNKATIKKALFIVVSLGAVYAFNVYFGDAFPWFVGVALGVVYLFVFDDYQDPVYTPEDRGAEIADFEAIKNAELLGGSGIPIGYKTFDNNNNPTRHLLHYAGENHLFTCGKAGSGKGATIIVPALLEFGGSCIVIDPKGQNTAITARQRARLGHKVFILNPYNVLSDHLNDKGDNVQNLAGFNPLDRIRSESDSFVADVRSLAQALIVDSGKGDSHWPDTARELVSALIMHVCRTASPERRNLGEVRALLAQPLEGFLNTITDMMESDFAPLAQKAAQFSEGTNEIKSVISAARTQLAFLDDPAICAALAKSDFSFSDLKREKITVYLVLPFKQLEAQGRWLRLLITSAIEDLTEEPREDDSRVLFILDEFAQLGRLPAIERALALVRGYKVQLWPFIQDLPQLQQLYPERWESFLSGAGVQQFFTPNDKTTGEYVSNRCGQRLRRRSSSSISTTEGKDSKSATSGSSSSDHWEPLFQPWELYGRNSITQMIFVEELSPVVCAYRWPYFLIHPSDPNLNKELADPDPFHL
ncbi:type IV secretory system conjugative DNA transfer family protein (plasmid) [Methylomonas sp. 2BW1-5-20]|uniref:type IV secretory system conjugative DNA transfer family protein n=1 Tax=Methylomonas sp. 2BW1-5-20 TaxID=3376686 RepID=UPI00404E97A2